MKYSIVFLLSMLIYINSKVDYTSCSTDYEITEYYDRSTTYNSTGIDNCKNRLNSTGDDKGYSKCCYIEYTDPGDNELTKNCISLTEYQYDHVSEYLKYQALSRGYGDGKIDCNSFNLYLSLISFILIILYF